MIDVFIRELRETDPYIKSIFLEGGCYRFHLLLNRLFDDCQPMMNSAGNHVATLYNGKCYDITGEVSSDDFHPMTTLEESQAMKWSFHENMALQVNECPACGEPIIV